MSASAINNPDHRAEPPPAARSWDLHAEHYDAVFSDLWFYQEVCRRHVAAMTRPGLRVVADLGAGTGNVSIALLRAGVFVTAVDSSQAMLDKLDKKLTPDLADRLKRIEGRCEQLASIPDASQDGVTIMLVLYDVADPAAAFQEALRILRGGGTIIVTEPKRCFRLGPLLREAEYQLRKRPDWSKLQAHWRGVFEANRGLDPQADPARRSNPRLCAEDIGERLAALEYEDIRFADSHLGNCATVTARKPS